MAHNDKKIISVLMEEMDNIPNRSIGYKMEMKELVSDVLLLEREHQISKIDIVKKIADKINASGKIYYRNDST
jgi:hypothetical protein